ncbi:MAG: CarD family transcriptional regulator [Bryobacteraceae bacterium]|jgi:CarD family transcriptional regulator
MTFQIGDKVVYPNQGVGTIENISTRPFGSVPEKFYLLRLGCGGMTVLVPFSNVDNVGLRRVTKEREISLMLAFLSTSWYTIRSDWKVRFRENSEKMQSGDLLKVAEVFKGLLQLHCEKPLSFREKKMLDRSRHMLIAEISIASHVAEPEAAAMLQRSLAKVGLAIAAVATA